MESENLKPDLLFYWYSLERCGPKVPGDVLQATFDEIRRHGGTDEFILAQMRDPDRIRGQWPNKFIDWCLSRLPKKRVDPSTITGRTPLDQAMLFIACCTIPMFGTRPGQTAEDYAPEFKNLNELGISPEAIRSDLLGKRDTGEHFWQFKKRLLAKKEAKQAGIETYEERMARYKREQDAKLAAMTPEQRAEWWKQMRRNMTNEIGRMPSEGN